MMSEKNKKKKNSRVEEAAEEKTETGIGTENEANDAGTAGDPAGEKPAEEAEKEPEASREEAVKIAELEKQIEEKDSQLAELNDRFLRMAAEYDNYKKRTSKEKDELAAFSKAELVKALLPVFDNVDRASVITDGEKLAEGVALINKSFQQTLEKIGIKEIDVLGKEFDPNLCEAIFHVDEEGKPENTVCEVLQKGYIYGDKVVRHALVKVVN